MGDIRIGARWTGIPYCWEDCDCALLMLWDDEEAVMSRDHMPLGPTARVGRDGDGLIAIALGGWGSDAPMAASRVRSEPEAGGADAEGPGICLAC